MKQARLKKHLTQEEASKRIGMSKSHLQKLESGERLPSMRTAQKVAEFYGMSIQRLFPTL